ncbi:uncharacterized protein LOC113927063 [Zalophus californianus]|uniref:Uncharacterized protein LOC113927063 n=1 Tax=Zalophus californianus TaxID=9704 RepID=A0A6J2DUR8_ZALCA|nr:uncharacterized protein LOC113927063 [Zalophus californianus]
MEVCSSGSRASGGRGGRPRGWGPPGSGRGGAGRGDRAGGCGGFPPVTSGAVSTSSLLLARPVLQEREPRIMSGFVFLRARGSLRMMVIFFFPQLEEKMRQRLCGRRARGEHGGGGGGGETRGGRASRACGRKRRLGARGAARERLWEQRRLGDGGRAAAGLLHRPTAHSALGPGPPRSITPRHWCVPA